MFRRRSRTPRPSGDLHPSPDPGPPEGDQVGSRPLGAPGQYGEGVEHASRLIRTGRTQHRPAALRRLLAGVSAAAVIATGLAVAGSFTAGAATANLVANSGFEKGLSDWTCPSGTAEAVGGPVRSGISALKAAPTGQDDARCTQTISVQPNSQYTLSAYVQGSYVYIGVTGTGITGAPSTWTPNSPSYSQLGVGFTTGPDTTSVTIYLHGWYGQPAYYADDVLLSGSGDTDPRRRPPHRPRPRPPPPHRRPPRRATPARPSPGRQARSSRATGRTGTAPPTVSTPAWVGSPSRTAGLPRTGTTSSMPPSR